MSQHGTLAEQTPATKTEQPLHWVTLRLGLAYLLTAAFAITSVVMVGRVLLIVGGLAATWHMQPIPGMVVDHAVMADGAARIDLPGVAEAPSAVFVVRADAPALAGWAESKLGAQEVMVKGQTYPILWEATDWATFPNREGTRLDSCKIEREGAGQVIYASLDPAVQQALSEHKAFILVAYNPQDASPREFPTT